MVSCSDVNKKLKAMAYPCDWNSSLRRETRNWAAWVQASNALIATSRLNSSKSTGFAAPDST